MIADFVNVNGMSKTRRKANAALTVEAVNSYDRQRETIKALVQALDSAMRVLNLHGKAMAEQAEAALALARKEEE